MLERSTGNKEELIKTKNGGREGTDWEDDEIFELPLPRVRSTWNGF